MYINTYVFLVYKYIKSTEPKKENANNDNRRGGERNLQIMFNQSSNLFNQYR